VKSLSPWLIALLLAPVCLHGQTPPPPRTEAETGRVGERIGALQREADALAAEARTLLGDLRTLEVERGLQIARERQAQAAVAEGQAAVDAATARFAALEAQRVAQLPDIEAQLVDLYKRGQGGYARMLFGAGSVREFGRTTRAVGAMIRISEERIAEYRRTLEALQRERESLDAQVSELQASEAAARRARAAADRAVEARAGLIRAIDARRDMNAQLAGELQVAYDRLQAQMANLQAGRPVETIDVPIGPFRGALDWPVAGRVTGTFGQSSGRLSEAVAGNGVEIAVAEGAPVRAVHAGRVSFAGPFGGFGNLVILDHGANNYTLYGYLTAVAVGEGDIVAAGAMLGGVGAAPAGPPALYFELRIDGRSVDPVEWFEAQ
jgi:septal ring factor EnvC (AmiA/AmiB activator)